LVRSDLVIFIRGTFLFIINRSKDRTFFSILEFFFGDFFRLGLFWKGLDFLESHWKGLESLKFFCVCDGGSNLSNFSVCASGTWPRL